MPSVLIIDDDENIRSQYTAALKRKGFTVRQAAGSKEALQQFKISVPDLIILDVLMPEIDGLTLLDAADMATNYPDTKVVIASNVDKSEFERELLGLKVARYIRKTDYTPSQVAEVAQAVLGD
ncbi:MAG TPA: response regulator [Candidatus Saccharimonadia bacterium]|jgi:hypothetical protein|nr:response regulator [Candidatus Saccharimonadia bacterium]